MEQLGLELALMWDPDVYKARTLSRTKNLKFMFIYIFPFSFKMYLYPFIKIVNV